MVDHFKSGTWCFALKGSVLETTGKAKKSGRELPGTGGWESLFQLALLADAGDEEAAVIRAHDGMVHVAAIPALIRGFINRLEFLFLQRGALRTEGYSKFVHEWLQSSHLVPEPQGKGFGTSWWTRG